LDEPFRIAGDVASFRDVPSDSFVDVFDTALLPRVVGMAEIYFDTEQLFKPLVVVQEKIVVGRSRLHLGETFLDPEECPPVS